MRLFEEELKVSSNLPCQFGNGSLAVEDTWLDILAVGEADDSWPELIRRLRSGAEIDSISGLVTRSNRRADGKVNLRNRTGFLDDLPFLDRSWPGHAKTRLRDFWHAQLHDASAGLSVHLYLLF